MAADSDQAPHAGTASSDLELSPGDSPASPEDRLWQRDAERARRLGLSSVQRTAERWGTTLLAVTGLLTTVTALQGPRDLAAVRDLWPWKILGGGLAALAIIVAGVAVLLAALAAQGKPEQIVASGPELRRVSLAQTSKAVCRLKWSRLTSILVIPLYLGALAVATYAPRQSPIPVVAIEVRDGSLQCAVSITRAGDSYTFSTNGQSRVLPEAQVLSITAVSSCQPRDAPQPTP